MPGPLSRRGGRVDERLRAAAALLDDGELAALAEEAEREVRLCWLARASARAAEQRGPAIR